jgi:hypothetical protein
MRVESKEREKNPLKEYAIHLAHQMDDEKRMRHEFMPEWKMDEIKICGRELRDEIFKKGYAGQIETILHYAEEYKTLSWDKYTEWKYI